MKLSIKIMAQVWDDESLPVEGTTLLVLLCLADYAHDDDPCAWPSIAKLARRTRRSERTVQRSLDELQALGIVSREMRSGRSTLYRLNLSTPTPVIPAPPSQESPTPDTDDTHGVPPTTPISISDPSSSSAFPLLKEGVSDQPKPDNLPRPVRAYLEELLPSADPAIVKGWTLTWQAVQAMEEGHGDKAIPALHVVLEYLSWCKSRSITPVASHPVEWYARKMRDHYAALASAPRQDDDAEGEEWERKILRRPLRDWNPSIPGMD